MSVSSDDSHLADLAATLRPSEMADALLRSAQEAAEAPLRVCDLVDKHCPELRDVIRELEYDCFFAAVALAVWDNVSGPQLRRVWCTEQAPPVLFAKVLSFVPKCTLNDQASRDDLEEEVEMKFYVLNELGHAISSFIFNAQECEGKEPLIFTLNLIFDASKVTQYLPIHKLVVSRTRHILRLLQVLLERQGKHAYDSFTAHLRPFLTDVTNLGVTGGNLDTEINIQRTVFGRGNEVYFDISFLRRAITSHLQTGGATLVVGKDIKKVNAMILSLALFLSPEERMMSRFAHADQTDTHSLHSTHSQSRTPGPYSSSNSTGPIPPAATPTPSHAPSASPSLTGEKASDSSVEEAARDVGSEGDPHPHAASLQQLFAPDLFLQGFVMEGEPDIDPLMLIKSQRPSTVVNLNRMTVKQTKNFNDHHVLKHEKEKEELEQLKQQGVSRRNVSLRNFFHDVTDDSHLVKALWDEVFKPYHPSLREGLISQFRRLLCRKALAVVQFVEARESTGMRDDDIRRMRRDLNLRSPGDFDIVLAFAEKLRAGVFVSVRGDRVAMQEQLVNLLTAF
eukprot:m.102239 g.102239  ORF g.102239 m.102239 type:complete len:565 (-) comp18766_c0_seq1:63-1757(-)